MTPVELTAGLHVRLCMLSVFTDYDPSDGTSGYDLVASLLRAGNDVEAIESVARLGGWRALLGMRRTIQKRDGSCVIVNG